MGSELSQSHNMCSTYFGNTEVRQSARYGTDGVCESCGNAFTAWRGRTSDRRRGRFCSRSCSSRYASLRKHEQKAYVGEANPNWKGGVSKQPSRYTRRFKVANPEKVAAQWAVRAAVAKGVLVRPSACSVCDTACKPHGHHDDYTKPLTVRWLCQPCHNAHHAARRKQAA